jgi:hypothetical protein
MELPLMQLLHASACIPAGPCGPHSFARDCGHFLATAIPANTEELQNGGSCWRIAVASK